MLQLGKDYAHTKKGLNLNPFIETETDNYAKDFNKTHTVHLIKNKKKKQCNNYFNDLLRDNKIAKFHKPFFLRK